MKIFKNFLFDEISGRRRKKFPDGPIYLITNGGNDTVGSYDGTATYYNSYGTILLKNEGVLTSICTFPDANKDSPRWYSTAHTSYSSGSTIVTKNPYCKSVDELVWDSSAEYDVKDGIDGLFDDVYEVNYLGWMFKGNTWLLEVPDFSSVETIKDNSMREMFINCTSMGGEFNMSGVKTIGNYGLYHSFRYCSNMKGTLDFSNLVSVGTSGMRNCFEGNVKLSGSVDFSNLTSLGGYSMSDAFYGCTGLDGNCPDLSSITTIGVRALYETFYGCENLKGTPILPDIEELPTYVFKSIYQNCSSLTGTPVFPKKATKAPSGLFHYAFHGCTGLTGCPDLTNFTELEDMAFYYTFNRCVSISNEVSLPSATEYPTNSMRGIFYGCENLKGTPDLSKVEVIGEYGIGYAFYNCKSLTGTPDFSNIVSVGAHAFDNTFFGCKGLTGDIYFTSLDPEQVTITGTTATNNPFYRIFWQCTGLDSVHFPASLTDEQKSYLTKTVLFGGNSGTYAKTSLQIYFDL